MRHTFFKKLGKLALPKRKLPYLAFCVAANTVYLWISSRLGASEGRFIISSCLFILVTVIPCRKILTPFLNAQSSVWSLWKQGSIAWIIQQMAYYLVFKEMKELFAHSEGIAMYMKCFREYLLLVPAMIAEEICILFVLLLAYNLLPFSKQLRGVAAAVIAAAYFGLSHIFVWGCEYGLMVFTTRLFVELYFLYVMDLRPFIFFHTVNDWIAFTPRIEALNLCAVLLLLLTWPAMQWLTVRMSIALGLKNLVFVKR